MTTSKTSSQRGFTLIELMIVVAIITVLAAVVVPTWMRETRKAKADTEINAMFNEITIKEQQYKQENNGAFLAATTTCPTSPTSAGVNFNTTCVTTGTPWLTMRISATDSVIRCTYSVTTGAAGTTITPPTGFTVASQPAGAWFYILGTCDMDAQGGTNATFFVTSVDSAIQKYNYGK